MNRITKKFIDLKQAKKKAFIPFITAGDPDLETTKDLVLAFEKAGADIVELGVPFSDPLADGPIIQAASQRSLDKGTTLEKVLLTVELIRRSTEVPLALMLYYNQVYHYGLKKFVQTAVKMGVDGVIIPDLPPEEGSELIAYAKEHDLCTIFFLSPTTSLARMKKNIAASTGFIYHVSLTGVTGTRVQLPASLLKNVKAAQKLTDKPICVGFGVSTAEQVKQVGVFADGVIVGSAIVKEIDQHKSQKNLVEHMAKFIQTLKQA